MTTPLDDPTVRDGQHVSLSPAEKLAVAHGLRETAWELTAAGIRLREPDLPEANVQVRVREIFLRAAT